jgi:ABC-type dipeptide/oligopeptide/nickel transport system permease subunit
VCATDLRVPAVRSAAGRSRGWGTLARREWPAALGGVFLTALILLAAGAPWITPYTYDRQDLDHLFGGPSAAHWFGTDQFGRDVSTRIVYGARITLAVGSSAVLAESLVGVAWGTVAGFYGGTLDNVLMRIVDLLIAFPSMLLAILVTGIFGPSLVNIVLALALTAWPGTARIIRSEVVALREREFIEGARALGASAVRILIRHLVPNVMHLVVVRATLDVSALILIEATLSFIGIGVQPPRPSWGLMISESFQYLQSHPHLVIVPAAVLSLTVVSFNLVGGSLTAAFDPRKRSA